ncbi:MAG TPA: hypothetical protein DDY98_04880 [Ruminococcaceae bacterium]|nr:hypothetical protein [Oscillospiraceae bacterium]
MNRIREYSYVYLIGAVLYCCFEIAVRGYTHWSMALTGGLAFLLLYQFNLTVKTPSITLRCLAGSGIITSLEFTVGCLVNRTLGWHVWDYSARGGHILGQICPMFSIVWFLLSLPAIPMTFSIKERLFSNEKATERPYKFEWFFTPPISAQHPSHRWRSFPIRRIEASKIRFRQSVGLPETDK